MEALQCTEANTEAVIVATTSEPNRILKRNIGELAVDGKLNENLKSPARKEAKISHELYLRRELEQWKELMKEKGIKNSVALNEIEPHDTDFDAILKPDQRIFMAGQVDVDSWIEESCKFRHKFDFFLRLNRVIVNMRTDRNEEAADKAKQQAIKFETDFMHCEQYNPIES